MASLKKISQPVLPRKRALDDDDDCELDEIRETRPMASNYPPPKIRTGVQAVRDFPPGCGIMDNSLGNKGERNPLKNSDNVDSKLRNMTSHDNDKSVASRSFENNKFKTNGLGGNKPSFGSKPQGKVKYWDPILSKEGDAQKSKLTIITVVSPKEFQGRREKIKEAMSMFDGVYKQLCLENRLNSMEEKIGYLSVSMQAAKIVKQRNKLRDVDKIPGPVCGVQVGDTFKFKSQLQMVGLHCQPQAGIDYTKIQGKNLAISIVDSHRYSNIRESCEVLVYSGHGGVQQLLRGDQKLERGNLALKNSMNEETPVRVIRKLRRVGKNNVVFVYDGLYIVKKYTQKRGEEGKMVFMFRLERLPGQPELHKMLNAKC